jgi:hypothetical protein
MLPRASQAREPITDAELGEADRRPRSSVND